MLLWFARISKSFRNVWFWLHRRCALDWPQCAGWIWPLTAKLKVKVRNVKNRLRVRESSPVRISSLLYFVFIGCFHRFKLCSVTRFRYARWRIYLFSWQLLYRHAKEKNSQVNLIKVTMCVKAVNWALNKTNRTRRRNANERRRRRNVQLKTIQKIKQVRKNDNLSLFSCS